MRDKKFSTNRKNLIFVANVLTLTVYSTFYALVLKKRKKGVSEILSKYIALKIFIHRKKRK